MWHDNTSEQAQQRDWNGGGRAGYRIFNGTAQANRGRRREPDCSHRAGCGRLSQLQKKVTEDDKECLTLADLTGCYARRIDWVYTIGELKGCVGCMV